MKELGRKQPYGEWMARTLGERSSRVILALDIDDVSPEAGLRRVRGLLDKTLKYLCAVKLGRQTILNLGPRRTSQVTRIVHDHQLPCIVDDKLNDIGPTNNAIMEAYFRLGLDALTANPFVGWEGGLAPVFSRAREKGVGILLLVYMSHPGAKEGYGQNVAKNGTGTPQYIAFARKAVKWKADGAVVGATRPAIVREVKSILRSNVPVYSPGVGVQGGDVRKALDAGTDYFIIGRSITSSPNPRRAAARFAALSF